jgi:hypothetical protein
MNQNPTDLIVGAYPPALCTTKIPNITERRQKNMKQTKGNQQNTKQPEGGPKKIRQPKGLYYRAIYEPDMQRMVRALLIILEYNPENHETQDKPEHPLRS